MNPAQKILATNTKKTKEVHAAKTDFDKKAIRRFYQAFLVHKTAVFLSLAMVPFSIASSLGLPWLMIIIVDNHIVTKEVTGLYTLVVLYVGLFLTGFLADITYAYSLQKVGIKVIATIRARLFEHVIRLPKQYFDKTPSGVTLTRLINDFETIGESLAVGVVGLIVELLKTLVYCVFLVVISWRLSLIVAISVPILFLVGQLIRLKLRKVYDAARLALADSVAYLSECLQGMKTILLMNSFPYSYNKYQQKNEKFLRPQKAANIYEALLYSIFEGMATVTIAIILVFGNFQIQSYGFSIGTLIVFYQVMQRIFIPIRELAQQLSTIQRAIASMAGIERLFAQPIESNISNISSSEKGSASKPMVVESIVAEELFFQYYPEQEPVLNHINFVVNQKERVAFVGRTGSGKSTIFKLLTKQYHHYEGSLKINGVEVKNWSMDQLHTLFSVMSQDTFLFADSLENNVTLGNQASAQKVDKAIDYVQLRAFFGGQNANIKNYQITEQGKNLSVGQLQMIGIARAVAADGPVFLFDEATATIDSVTEHYIQAALEKIFQEKTVLAIAHRLSTIKHSDRIYCMQKGKIIEQGSHHELIAKKGYYYNLQQKKGSEFSAASTETLIP